ERPKRGPPDVSPSFTSGPSFWPFRRPANTVKPSAANFLTISAPIQSPAPITAAVALRFGIFILHEPSPSSLRAKRSNPECFCEDSLDCFVAALLAMTKLFTGYELLDFAQLLLAEEHLLADKESRRAECAALDRRLRVLEQLCLHIRLLRAGQQLRAVKAGRGQRLHRDVRIVHLLRLTPHVMEGGLDIFLEHALELRCDRRAHQVQRVDREERVEDIGL